MLRKSQEADSGVKLEVNARILDSCTELMKNIKLLIEKSKSLQREIVSSGKVLENLLVFTSSLGWGQSKQGMVGGGGGERF